MYSGGYKGAYSTGYACDMGKSSEKNTPAYHDPLVQQYAFILGENLRQLRKAQGLTQERLGLMIGTGHSPPRPAEATAGPPGSSVCE